MFILRNMKQKCVINLLDVVGGESGGEGGTSQTGGEQQGGGGDLQEVS